MGPDTVFNGFSKQTVKFFRDLEKNNSKKWFDQNRDTYDEYVMKPAVEFVKGMGEKLKSISPDIVADPRRDKSIFRLNRDTRFSNNKVPYKTHLGIYFWEGEGKKLENPGFYFQLDQKNIMLGAGMHIFPKQMLKPYRDAVTGGTSGSELKKIISKISKYKNYKLGWSKYKKIPRGYDPNHPNSEYLLYGGIGFIVEDPLTDVLYSEKLVDHCFKFFKDVSPLHSWLTELSS